MLSFGNLFSSFWKSVKNQKGSTLMTVLIIMLIFAVIGSAVLITSANNLRVAQRVSEYEDIYYMAEANAQYGLSYVKEEIIKYYAEMKEIPAGSNFEYSKKMENFYPTIIATVTKEQGAGAFNPLDFSEQGVETEINISVDESTVPTGGFGDEGDPVKFIIESVAESENSRRVVTAILMVDDPDVRWKLTSGPPMTDMRMLIGGEVILSDDLSETEYNAIFCRSSAMVGYQFNPQFTENHAEYLGTYTYDYSNAVPEMLEWDLQYEKFPPYAVFDTFETLFDASTPGTDLYYEVLDWRNATIKYDLMTYAPRFYDNKDIIDKNSKNDVDWYFPYSYTDDYKPRYNGTVSNPVTVLAVGTLYIHGSFNITNCYIFAVGDVRIVLNGHIENTIIVSDGGKVDITCDYISNTDGVNYLIKGNNDVNITLDEGAVLERIVGVSTYGKVKVQTNNSSQNATKITMKNSYIYTNELSSDARVELKSVYVRKSFVNAGKDLALINCSGDSSGFYAHGMTDSESDTYYERKKLFLGDTYSDKYLDYNKFLQYPADRDYWRRWMRGIIFVSQLPPINNSFSPLYENTFVNCDFTTDQSIYLCDPRFSVSGHVQLITLDSSRLLANREVLLEDVAMDGCYIYAGIDGYEDEEEVHYIWPWGYYTTACRGIYMRMDRMHNDIYECIFYSRGKMIYSQHSPEEDGYPVTVEGKVRVDRSLFYSIRNFEYNGTSTSEGLDTTVMRNDSSLCNGMIIMTEEDVNSHEFVSSAPDDVLFIGGDMGLDPDQPHFSQVLDDLFGPPGTGFGGGALEVQYTNLYLNYFEQKLADDEVIKEVPSFGDVFIFEDIYEKKEAEMEGS